MLGHRFTCAADALNFIQAGNATITAVSVATGTRFTYRVRESNDGKLFFVSLLNGPDNTTSYTYMGIIRGNKFTRTNNSKVTQDAPSYKAFVWLFDQLSMDRLPPTVELYHEGRCGRCNRLLTVPESIEAGIGPECARHVHRPAAQLALAI